MLYFDEQDKNTVYFISIFTVCYTLLILNTLTPLVGNDVFWHLQMGKDLLEKGASPWIDHYSFTHNGNEISSAPIIFQILLASFASIFGEDSGFQAFKLFYITLFIAVLYRYFKKIKAPWPIVLLILPFLSYLITLRLIIRPELISNILIVICLFLYLRARNSFSTKNMLLISLLLLAWTNYHSPIFGYIITFGLFLDRAAHKLFYKDYSFTWSQWFLWACIIFITGFSLDNGQHILISTLSTMNTDFGKFTLEYLPSNYFYSKNYIVYILWAISFYTAVVSLIKKQFGFSFITILLLYFSWTTTRLVVPVAITNLCILGAILVQLPYSINSFTLKPLIRKTLLFIAICIPILSFYFLIKSTITAIDYNSKKEAVLAHQFPVQIVDYLVNYQSPGNILNSLAAGGYLINKLPQDFRVFIDGRTNILYPIDFFMQSINIEVPKYDENHKIKSDALINALNSYDVQYAIYKNKPDTSLLFRQTDKLKLNFADERFLLFSNKKNIAFPISSQFIVHPMCWSSQQTINIEKEIKLADALFINKSYTIKSILLFLKQYLSSDNKLVFLEKTAPEDLASDSIKRLAAYISLDNREYQTALKYFNSINYQHDYDILMSAYALTMDKNFPVAENLLYYYYTISTRPEQSVSYHKMDILNQLLKLIQEEYDMKVFLPSFIDDIDNKLKDNNYPPAKSIIPLKDVCNSSS